MMCIESDFNLVNLIECKYFFMDVLVIKILNNSIGDGCGSSTPMWAQVS